MVLIKKLEDIVAKWKEVTPARAPYYEKGVRSPLRDWATNAAAAEPAWEAGVQDAVSNKRFEKGVKKVGTAKWQNRAIAVGPGRFREGVGIAAPDYQAGFAPFHEELSKLVLPARGRRGDPKNIDRVRAIADALHKKRVALLGSSGA